MWSTWSLLVVQEAVLMAVVAEVRAVYLLASQA
jgi:hypothetical protein